MENRPKRIKAELFAYDNVTADEIKQGIDDLERLGFLCQYEASTRLLIYIENFSKHQNPHQKEKENGFSLPTRENRTGTVLAPDLHSSSLEERGKRKEESVTPNDENGHSAKGEQDLSFQQPKYSPEDVVEITVLATTIYKNTEYPNQVQPAVHNLLPQIDKETIIRAIKKASALFDRSGRDHDKRPGFAKHFASVQCVKEILEKAETPPTSTSERNLDDDMNLLPPVGA